MTEEIDCNNTEEITCPYCGYAYTDSFEFRNDTGEERCNSCKKKFYYSRDIYVSYSTEKMEG